MKIGEKTFVSLSYELTVDGNVVDSTSAENPLSFVFGAGYLLPAFEKNIEGLSVGDKFAFVLDAENGYGEMITEAVVELPKDIFMVDGAIEDGLLELGNQLPMSDNQGNRMVGTVKTVTETTVTMDFNHPMAGKVLNFAGAIVGVREATDADMMQGQVAAGGCECGCGCDDNCDCDDNCNCDDESKCGESCNCN